jgi:Glycosyl transferase family 2
MKLVCIMPVRNEEWVIGLSARAVLMWCDELVVLNHRSTDGTREILTAIAAETGRLRVVDCQDEQWEEMKHRQMLLTIARNYDATHIAMIDGDEVLSGQLVPLIRDWFETAPKGTTITLPWLCLRGDLETYHAEGTWGGATVSMGFVDEPRCHWTAQEGGYDFHHRHPMGRPYVPWTPTRIAGVLHLQFVNARRLCAKQALYKMTEVLRWPGRRTVDQINRLYNVAVYGYETKQSSVGALAHLSKQAWEPYGALMKYLAIDAAPWQAAECRRLYVQHGHAPFAGLDLFGVVG